MTNISHQHYFATRLAEGIGTLAVAFYPKAVIVRFNDFKSDVVVMILLVLSADEARKVVSAMAEQKLERGKQKLKLC